MVQPTVFVQFETRAKDNPCFMAIRLIVESMGCVIADKLVDDKDVEVDIAVTNTIETALLLIKETENAIIFLGYLGADGFCASKEEALAFATRFPRRVKVGPLVEATGEENLITILMRTITEMNKENK